MIRLELVINKETGGIYATSFLYTPYTVNYRGIVICYLTKYGIFAFGIV